MFGERRVLCCGAEYAAERTCCFLVSLDVEEPAIASVVIATGATTAAAATAHSIMRNMTRFLVSIPPCPVDAVL
jgi:hypothetical protein